MVDYLSTLHPFYINALTTLPQYDALELTEAVVHIMNKLPAEQLLPVLQSFCLPIAQKLHELASRPVGATERSTVVKELDGRCHTKCVHTLYHP